MKARPSNGEPVRRPCLIWDQLMERVPNTDTFLRLLPITAADYNQYETSRFCRSILRRRRESPISCVSWAAQGASGFCA